MVIDDAPIRRDLVLVGGGHSHVAVLKAFGMRPLPGTRLTLVSRDALTPYSGMLPGLLAGHYTVAESHIDLRPLCHFAGARLFHSRAIGLDLDQRQVLCDNRPPVPFDLLSIDIGSVPGALDIPGAATHALAVKPVGDFLQLWPAVERRVLDSRGRFRLLVIGAGAGGVELCLSLQHRLRQRLAAAGRDPAGVSFAIATDRREILVNHNAGVRRRMLVVLAARGIAVHIGQPVTSLAAGRALLADGAAIDFDAAVLVTTAAAAPWLRQTGLALDADGFITVGRDLRSVSHAEVFAAGDTAAIAGAALPKAGVYAVRQGPVLAANLRARLLGQPTRDYRPQRRALALISTGDRKAIASYDRWALAGAWVWQLKDRIDRRWMRKYQHLPAMPGTAAAPTGEDTATPAMLCGGCGAKIPSAILRRVLARLPAPTTTPPATIGLAADDAAVFAVPPGKLLVQSVDHFRGLIDDPYLFGQITATHCLGDLYAMGAAPHSAQAQVTLPAAGPAQTEDMLYQLLAGAVAVLGAAGASLIGGHSGTGAELSFGLVVNGLAMPDQVTTKGGAQAGDRLVLSKPLGTGVVFAADMRGQASSGTVEAALAMMLRSSATAAAIARAHGVHAATDVTGFGLLGHLLEMLEASGMAASLDLDVLPALPQALALLDRGIASSMQPGNLGFAAALEPAAARHPRYRLLFDPQTAGGLLLSLPAARAAAAVSALVAAGYGAAAIIGTVQTADPARPRVQVARCPGIG